MAYSLAPAVLIVEDEILIRGLAAEAFIDAGFIVFEAEHAAHALTIFDAEALFHILFTDVNMPGEMNGIDLAERLKGSAPDLHVIITSGLALPRPVNHLSATFVSKPYNPNTLVRTATNLLSQ